MSRARSDSHLGFATRCADDAEKPGSLDLLGLSASALAAFKLQFANASYADLQIAMENACEAGEVTEVSSV